MWIEEVAIGDTAVAFRRRKRGAAQHQLVDHELAIIFAERAVDGAVAGIGRVGAAGPLPDDAESVVEFTRAGGDLPFHLRWQMLAGPAGKGIRLVIADVTDGTFWIDGLQPA